MLFFLMPNFLTERLYYQVKLFILLNFSQNLFDCGKVNIFVLLIGNSTNDDRSVYHFNEGY